MRNLYFGDLYKKCTSSSSTKNHNTHKNHVVRVLTTKVQIETFLVYKIWLLTRYKVGME